LTAGTPGRRVIDTEWSAPRFYFPPRRGHQCPPARSGPGAVECL